ncbi:MAG: Oligopeptide transport system permease protein OppC [Firmicutes bacterium ADurb.Bin456]|nr:MAG: Oligopeptide transport system permease protein OppC [Firmicutes bacterium ADurb.Bin456]
MMYLRIVQNRFVLACLLLILLYVLVSFGGKIFLPYHPNAQNLYEANTGPSRAHWLGTDYLGRDLLARILAGLRISLVIAFFATLINITVGFLVGSTAGLSGGVVDRFLTGLIDLFWCIPPFLIVVMLTVVLEPGVKNIFIALGIVLWVPTARIIRGEVYLLRNAPFIQLAKIHGAGYSRIIFMHILPNCFPVLLTAAIFSVPDAVLAEAFLSIVGLGVTAPEASLGVLISDGLQSFRVYPWQWLFPVLTLTIFVLCFNLLGDFTHRFFRDRSKGILEND